jgi:hypothetical protein
MTDSTASTMSIAFHLRGGMKLDVKVNRATGDIGMTIKDPNYHGMIAIPDEYTKAYVHLFLHRTDLFRAREFLAEFDKLGVPTPNLVRPGYAMPVVAQSLWLSALGATMKCFQRSVSRKKLDPARVFGADKTQPVRAAFDLLKDLRNKHVLHDENDWMQTVPYAIYADAGNNQAKFGDINCVVLEGTDIAHIGQLRTVVDAACDWITEQIDIHTEAIRADLQGRAYSAVAAMPPPPSIELPHTGTIGKPRPRR